VLWTSAVTAEGFGDRRLCVSPGRARSSLFSVLVEKNFDAEAVLSFTKRLYRQLRAPMTMCGSIQYAPYGHIRTSCRIAPAIPFPSYAPN